MEDTITIAEHEKILSGEREKWRSALVELEKRIHNDYALKINIEKVIVTKDVEHKTISEYRESEGFRDRMGHLIDP